RSPRSSFHRRAAAARWRVVSGESRPSHPAPARSGPLGCLHQESRRESCPQQESLPATPASDFSPIWGIEVYISATPDILEMPSHRENHLLDSIEADAL